jgi:hypothetical protein
VSERYTIEYEVGDLLFEFTPSSGTKGDLVATMGEKPISMKVDLNGKKSRTEFVQEAYDLYPEAFTLPELEFRRALNDLATHVDDELKIRAAKAEEDDEEEEGVQVHAPEEGTDEYDAAMEVLRSGNILEEAAKTMLRLGHVGEWDNKKLAFVSAVSARAQLPVQPSTHAQSSAGKNYLWDTVLSLVPPELVYKRTGFSAKALFRTNMSLKHSVLYIQEVAGSEGADFSIRTLQSDNVLKWEATEKQPDGSLANVEYEVEGPTVIVQTTTKNHLHPENETRVVPLYLDESAEQTKRINNEAKRRAAGKGAISDAEREEMCGVWHDAVRLLEPAEVVLPYAERVEVPTQPIRLRRDVPRLIKIIQLVAWLHQHSRKKDDQGRIVATEADFDTALEIVGDSFARAWKSLTPTEEKIYEACNKHIPERLRRSGFKRKHVEDALEKAKAAVPTRSVKDALKTLAEGGFIETDGKRGPTGATYTVAKSSGAVGTIKLLPEPDSAAHLPIKDENGESGVGKPTSEKTKGETQSAHSCPLPNSEDERATGEKGRNGSRPLDDAEKAIPKPKSADSKANGQMGERRGRLRNEEVVGDYEHSEDE